MRFFDQVIRKLVLNLWMFWKEILTLRNLFFSISDTIRRCRKCEWMFFWVEVLMQRGHFENYSCCFSACPPRYKRRERGKKCIPSTWITSCCLDGTICESVLSAWRVLRNSQERNRLQAAKPSDVIYFTLDALKPHPHDSWYICTPCLWMSLVCVCGAVCDDRYCWETLRDI